jgi:hypothetical protein
MAQIIVFVVILIAWLCYYYSHIPALCVINIMQYNMILSIAQ